MVLRLFCTYCHIAFGEKEEKIFDDGGIYHEDCDKKRRRLTRIREFFRLDRGQKPIIVVPRRRR